MKRSIETLSEILGTTVPAERVRNDDLFSSNLVGEPTRHETFRVDSVDGLSLPNVILPASGDAEDFFATVATYYQHQTPISALVHVLGEKTACLFTSKLKSSNIRSSSHGRSFRLACLGAGIGEATLAGLGVRETGSDTSYSACRRTLAFSLCRATLLFSSEFQSDVLAERWTRLRKLTGLNVSAAATEAVLLAHRLASESSRISNLPYIDPKLSDALQKLVREGDRDGDLLVTVLIDLYPGTSRYFSEFQGPFDGRMSAFTNTVEAIRASSRGTHMDEIAVAVACNRILPGSFAHAGVIQKLIDFYPAAMVWYGFVASLTGESKSQQLNPGLTAKLERDLLDVFSFEQRPRCDISLEELEVISRIKLKAEMIKSSQQRAILVSLLPGVDVYTRFDSERESVKERFRHDKEIDKLQGHVAKLLEEALFTLKKATKGSVKEAPKRRKRKD
ncbi:MAG TPA: hypothetical protein ENJ35_03855 [Gammaproteobacteria bacterium]|nr:hypothetical protein [Gammaproteobacteria bacterium]